MLSFFKKKRNLIIIAVISVILIIGITLAAVLSNKEEPEREVFIYGDFSYTAISSESAEIVGYSGDIKNVVLPDIIEGLFVTRIGDGAFMGV